MAEKMTVLSSSLCTSIYVQLSPKRMEEAALSSAKCLEYGARVLVKHSPLYSSDTGIHTACGSDDTQKIRVGWQCWYALFLRGQHVLPNLSGLTDHPGGPNTSVYIYKP